MALTTPARPQFTRFDDTGEAPTIGHPGSFAVNLPDRKLWTFDVSGVPILISNGIYPHDVALAYSEGDFVLETNSLFVANTAVSPGAFNPAQWDAVIPDTAAIPSEPAGSGLISGGLMTFSSVTQVNVAAGTGVIVLSQDPATVTHTAVSWSGQLITLSPGADTEMVVAVDSAGVAAGYSISLVDLVRRTLIVVGYTTHDDTGEIIAVSPVSKITGQVANLVSDFIRAVGGPFRISGCDVTPNGANMALDVALGSVFSPHVDWRAGGDDPNIAVFPGDTSITFDTIKADGEVVTTGTTLDPDIYESGAVPPGFATIHYLFATPTGSRFALQLGQTLYLSLSAAQAALGDDWKGFTPAYVPDVQFLLLAALVVMAGATDLSDPAEASVLNVLSGPQRGVLFQYPQITSDQYLPVDGSLPMTGDLDMDGNSIIDAVIDEGTF